MKTREQLIEWLTKRVHEGNTVNLLEMQSIQGEKEDYLHLYFNKDGSLKGGGSDPNSVESFEDYLNNGFLFGEALKDARELAEYCDVFGKHIESLGDSGKIPEDKPYYLAHTIDCTACMTVSDIENFWQYIDWEF
jgi:hypothetical protein